MFNRIQPARGNQRFTPLSSALGAVARRMISCHYQRLGVPGVRSGKGVPFSAS